MCSCQRTAPTGRRAQGAPAVNRQKMSYQVVGVTGLEPVTPRLSSACSNQLSYTPARNWLAGPKPAVRSASAEPGWGAVGATAFALRFAGEGEGWWS